MKKIRNRFEQKLATQLSRAKVKFTYETERLPYVLARYYIPDFIVETRTGRIFIEAKGHFRREDKAKLAAVKRQHPEIDIRLVFYKFNKVYEKWVIKHGFKYAFQSIPTTWLKE